jgi:phospholipid/cholesterol/gamma-HCH transport system substrate-binding protein
VPTPAPAPAPPDKVNGDQPRGAPSSFAPKSAGPLPAVATAQYDPRTGRYVSGDGHVYQQSDLVKPAAAKTWRDMLPT